MPYRSITNSSHHLKKTIGEIKNAKTELCFPELIKQLTVVLTIEYENRIKANLEMVED